MSNRLTLWVNFLKEIKPLRVAEIGVWKGDFAAKILRECEFIEEYIMVDPWAQLPDWNKPYNVETKKFNNIYNEAMQKTSFASKKIKILRGRTKDVIQEIEDESLDFIYIDGDHTLRGITIDLIKLFPKVKQGGYIGGDDFIPNLWHHSIEYEPTLVCPFAIYFAEAMELPIQALQHRQFVIKKDHSLGFSFTDKTGHYSNIALNQVPSAQTIFLQEVKSKIKSLIKNK